MFADPLEQFVLDLPRDWAYRPTWSALNVVAFTPWDTSCECVRVMSMATAATSDAPTHIWQDLWNDHHRLSFLGLADRPAPFNPLRWNRPRDSVIAEFTGSTAATYRQYIAIRGTYLDTLLEYTAPSRRAFDASKDILLSLGHALEVPSNAFEPAGAEEREMALLYKTALDDFERNDRVEAAEKAQKVAHMSRRAYLRALASRPGPPNPRLVLPLIGSLVLTSQANSELLASRDAEFVGYRAINTIKAYFSGKTIPPDWEETRQTFITMIEQATETQRGIRHKSGLADFLSSAWLLKQAEASAGRGAYAEAARLCDDGIAELVTLLHGVKAAEEQESAGGSSAATPQLAHGAFSSGIAGTVATALAETLRFGTYVNGERLGLDAPTADLGRFRIKVIRSVSRGDEESLKEEARAILDHVGRLLTWGDDAARNEASELLEAAESIVERIPSSAEEQVYFAAERARLFLWTGIREAGPIIRKGLERAQAAGYAGPHLHRLKNIWCQYLWATGAIEEARVAAVEADSDLHGRAPENARAKADALVERARMEARTGHNTEAVRTLLLALKIALGTQRLWTEIVYRVLLSLASLIEEWDLMFANGLVLAALDNLDVRRAMLPTDSLRVEFDSSPSRQAAYAKLLEHLVEYNRRMVEQAEAQDSRVLRQYAALHEVGVARAAIEAADRARARAHLHLMSNTSDVRLVPDVTAPSPLEALDTVQLQSAETDTVYHALDSTIKFVTSEAQIVLDSIGVDKAITAGEAQALLQQLDASALLIQRVHDRVALVLLKGDGDAVMVLSPMSAPDLAVRVAIVSQTLEIAAVSRGEGGFAAGSSPSSGDFERALQDISDALIGPLEWSLEGVRRLVISPYADLHAIPFAILPRSGHPLIARHPLTLVPSLSLLRRICGRRHWTGGAPKRAYIVGNPATKVQSRLPAAEKEAKLVAARLVKIGVPVGSVNLRLGDEATEESYRSEARNADFLHLACHARVREPAYDSRLYLAPSGPFDGILLASEVAQVQLSDAVVFLAACETAQGRFAPDGVVGLVRAFFEAGARAVVASLWRVDDSATYAFVRHFYTELLDHRASASVSEALRVATLATRKDLRAGRVRTQDGQPVEYSAANWGAFMVFGDGFSTKFGGSE